MLAAENLLRIVKFIDRYWDNSEIYHKIQRIFEKIKNSVNVKISDEMSSWWFDFFEYVFFRICRTFLNQFKKQFPRFVLPPS